MSKQINIYFIREILSSNGLCLWTSKAGGGSNSGSAFSSNKFTFLTRRSSSSNKIAQFSISATFTWKQPIIFPNSVSLNLLRFHTIPVSSRSNNWTTQWSFSVLLLNEEIWTRNKKTCWHINRRVFHEMLKIQFQSESLVLIPWSPEHFSPQCRISPWLRHRRNPDFHQGQIFYGKQPEATMYWEVIKLNLNRIMK